MNHTEFNLAFVPLCASAPLREKMPSALIPILSILQILSSCHPVILSSLPAFLSALRASAVNPFPHRRPTICRLQ